MAYILIILALIVIPILLTIYDSGLRERERELGVFWNGHCHKRIDENREEYEATRGLY